MSHELVLYGKGKGKGIDDPQKKIARRTIDYGNSVVRWLEDCIAPRATSQRLQCHYSFTKELLPPFASPQNPYDSICCRFVHSSTNKNRAPVNVVHWFPNGRRLISGAQTGEITIWNGFQFHFENILQAHNGAVKAMEWTPEENVLVTGDQLGVIKFWGPELYNFQTLNQAHKESSICDISIAPTGLKFVSCADDLHAKVWDLRTGEEERAFTGHGWDVKCCSWHPTKGLVATGSRDSQIKLWDPRAGEAITTIYCHKNTVTKVKWSPNGQWLASGSRDQLIMLMDIRMMSVRKVFKAHQKEVTALCWHPESDAVLASGGYDHAIHFWDTNGSSQPLESLPNAHDGPVWSLSWHPLGHLLVSGSHDYSTRFWSRARPGDTNFNDLMPKKAPVSLADPAAVVSLPTPGLDASVFDAGIFAGPPDPPPPEPARRPEAESNMGAAGEASQQRTTTGLTLGEGTSRKDVLDMSDFDAEEDGSRPAAAAIATSEGAGAAVAETIASPPPAATASAASVAPAATVEEAPAPASASVAAASAPAPAAGTPVPVPAAALPVMSAPLAPTVTTASGDASEGKADATSAENGESATDAKRARPTDSSTDLAEKRLRTAASQSEPGEASSAGAISDATAATCAIAAPTVALGDEGAAPK